MFIEIKKKKKLFFLKSFGSLKICITFAVRFAQKNQFQTRSWKHQINKQEAV